MDPRPIELRNAVMRRIRAFFHARGFLEVETPIILSTPCMEEHIDAIACEGGYLRTSPEISHKKLLAAGFDRIFEIGKCFRKGERGRLHHPEYTMLEWYRTGADYRDILRETRELLEAVWPERKLTWTEWTVSEAFRRFAGWDPVAAFDAHRFDLDLLEKIEPEIRRTGGAVVLLDYPAEAAALSRLKPGEPAVAERWELYLDGIELANAYSELTDADEQRSRFERWAERRAAEGREVYPIDEAFLSAVGSMPPAGGAALGIDRLLLCMSGAKSLDEIVPFRRPEEKS